MLNGCRTLSRFHISVKCSNIQGQLFIQLVSEGRIQKQSRQIVILICGSGFI